MYALNLATILIMSSWSVSAKAQIVLAQAKEALGTSLRINADIYF